MPTDATDPSPPDLLARADRRLAAWLAPSAPAADRVLVWGLFAVILLAGAHKLVAPGVWAAYLAPTAAAVWPLAAEPTMVLLGLSEVIVAPFLLAERYRVLAAAVVAVSLAGTVVGLVILAVETGRGVDVIIRDLGLVALAAGTALRAAAER